MENDNKRIVLVVNKTIGVGPAINAAAHAALGFGASRKLPDVSELHLLDFVDGSGGAHPHISALSLVVLQARPTQLQKLRDCALAEGLPCVSFTDTMTVGTYADQLDRTRRTPPDQLIYYAVLLFGTRPQLDPLTRRFSLFGRSNDPAADA